MSPAKNKSKSKSTSKSNANHQKAEIIFPHIHDKILASLSGDITPEPYFNHITSANAAHHSNEYSTNIMGTFLCTNTSCDQEGWGSKKIAIRIRRYLPGNGYNAVVFNQRCKSCQKLGSMTINEESYIDRVTYRLKKWAGVEVEKPQFNRREGPPHARHLCEGCKRGVCSWGREYWD